MLVHLKLFFKNKSTTSIGAGFFILGFLFGNWATLIPSIKSHYLLDDGSLGLLLLCLPLGAMFFNPFAAILVSRYGNQKMTVTGMVILSLAYAVPILVNNIYLLPLSLIFVGIAMTFLNISVNHLAAQFEKNAGMYIVSTCHGMFSVGLMTGSFMRSITLLADLTESVHMVMMCMIALFITWAAAGTILGIDKNQTTNYHSTKNKMSLSLPTGMMLLMIIISIGVNITEGCMSDWSSVYMKEVVQTNPYFVGWGLLGYSAFMAIGRFFGDGIIPIYGRNNVLIYGSVLSMSGLLIAILFPFTVTAFIGFCLVGLGVSCGAPILYASASRYAVDGQSSGLATMNTYAMGGFLIGPVIIGFISKLTSLPMAFGFIVGLCGIWLIVATKVKLP